MKKAPTDTPGNERLLKSILLGSAAVLACAVAPAYAQQFPTAPDTFAPAGDNTSTASKAPSPKPTETPAAQAPADQTASIGEIVVTARHETENLQTVPVAVTALTSKILEQRDVRSLPDIARYTPGLVFDRGSNVNGGSISAGVYIRGVGQRGAQPTADPAVGIYVDDIYFGRVVGSVLNVIDAERVEVLRGPQGTLYGKNTLGGAINIYSKIPHGDFDGYVDAAIGTYGEFNQRAAVEFPIAPNLAGRVSVSHLQHDGYDPNVITGRKMGSLDTTAIRAVLHFEPTDWFRANIFADASTEDDSGNAVQVTSIKPGFVTNPIFAPYVDNSRNTYGAALLVSSDQNNLDTRGAALHMEFDVTDTVKLTSITGYRWMKSHVGVDADGTPTSYNENEIWDRENQTSQELRFNGKLFGNRLDWQVGAFYSDENIEDTIDVYRRLVPAAAASFTRIRNLLSGKTKSSAVFTQDTLHLTDKLGFTAGVRYSHEEKRELVSSTPNPPFPSFGLIGFSNLTQRHSWTSTTPRFSLDFQATHNLLTYVSYAEGFKSGGFTYVTVFANDLTSYLPERTATWEAGAKWEGLNRRLRVNTAAFSTRYKDLQFESFFSTSPPCLNPGFCSRTLNAAEAEIKGIELEVTAAPTKGLNLFANASYMHNKVTKVDALALNLVNLNSKLPRTPDWEVTVGGTYLIPVGTAGDLTLRADYHFRSLTYFDFANQPGAAQDDYGLVNAGVAFDTADGRWQFAINAQNLTNKRYASGGTGATYNSDGYTFVSYGAPRTVTASLRFRFGR